MHFCAVYQAVLVLIGLDLVSPDTCHPPKAYRAYRKVLSEERYCAMFAFS